MKNALKLLLICVVGCLLVSCNLFYSKTVEENLNDLNDNKDKFVSVALYLAEHCDKHIVIESRYWRMSYYVARADMKWHGLQEIVTDKEIYENVSYVCKKLNYDIAVSGLKTKWVEFRDKTSNGVIAYYCGDDVPESGRHDEFLIEDHWLYFSI